MRQKRGCMLKESLNIDQANRQSPIPFFSSSFFFICPLLLLTQAYKAIHARHSVPVDHATSLTCHLCFDAMTSLRKKTPLLDAWKTISTMSLRPGRFGRSKEKDQSDAT